MASPRIELGHDPRQRSSLPLAYEAVVNLNQPNLFKHNHHHKSMFGRKKQRQEVGEHKFCPVCGTKIQLADAFCVRCGYSFAIRAEKNKKKRVKWRNTIIIIGILVLAYLGLRYANGQTIIPTSLADALKTLTGK